MTQPEKPKIGDKVNGEIWERWECIGLTSTHVLYQVAPKKRKGMCTFEEWERRKKA